jgi:hypothetical protein
MLLPVFALADFAVAGWLLYSAPRSPRNREAVITVAALLIGFGGLLAVLAVT